MSLMSFPAPAYAPLVCSVADADTIVSVSNNSGDTVYVIALDAADEQQELAELAAGETLDVIVPAGTVSLGFAQNDDWLGDVYPLTGLPAASVSVPYVQQAEAPPPQSPAQQLRQLQQGEGSIEAQFENTTPDDVTVTVVQDGTAYPLVDIAAGQTLAHRILPGAELWFYANQGATIVNGPYVVTGLDGELITIERAAARSTAEAAPADAVAALSPMQQRHQGEGSVEAEFSNPTADAVVAVALDEASQPQPLFEIAAGASVRQRVLPQVDLWFYKVDDGRKIGGPYVVAGLDGEVVTVEATAPAVEAAPALSAMQLRHRGDGSMDTEFQNVTPDTVVAAVLDEAQQPQPLFEIAAGEVVLQSVLPDVDLWFYRKDDGRRVAGPYIVTAANRFVRVETAASEANDAAAPTVSPATARLQAIQSREGSVELALTNALDTEIVVAVIDESQTPVPLVRIPVGQRVSQKALPGTELWFYRSDTSEALRYPYKVGAAGAVSIPYDPRAAIVAEQSGPGSFDIIFANLLPFPITVQVKRADGSRFDMMDVEAGAKGIFGRGLPGTVLSFVRAGTDALVSDDWIVPARFDGVDVPINAAQAAQTGPGSVRIRLMNYSGLPLDVVTTDKNGKGALLFDLKVGEGIGYVTRHANFLPGSKIWFMKKFTNEPVGEPYIVPALAGGVVNIPYMPTQAMLDQMGPGSIEISFQNGSPETAAITVVNAQGQHETLVKIPPGFSVSTRALPRAALWFYKGTTEEKLGVDMPYFVGAAGGQTVKLPYNPTNQQIMAMTGISIDKIIADFAREQAALAAMPAGPSFCWKDSYGRGVGTVPRKCQPGFSEDTAGLCWPNARPGYTCDFFVCRQSTCPAGFRDDGLTCFKPPPYHRDEYPVSFEEAAETVGDSLGWFFTFGQYEADRAQSGLDGARARCRAEHGNNCVDANGGTIVYETCKAGYEQAPIITNLCTPSCPSTMTDAGIFCAKHTYTRDASLMSCDRGVDNDAGLCYQACKPGSVGVGPVCWNTCPAKLPYGCGAGCAADKASCDGAIVDQTLSPIFAVGSIVLTVATAGGSTAATTGAKVGASAGKAAAATAAKIAAREAAKVTLKASVKAALIKAVKKGAKEVAIDAAIGAALGTITWGATTIAVQVKTRNALKERVLAEIVGTVSDERIDAVVDTMMAGAEANNPAADLPWTALDPSGVADIVIAYNHPICSDVK